MRALKDWLAVAKLEAGPVFRAADRHGSAAASFDDPGDAAPGQRACGQPAGLESASYSGHHSMRAGLVTAAASYAGAPTVYVRSTLY